MAEGLAEMTLFVGPVRPGFGFHYESEWRTLYGYREAIHKTFHRVEQENLGREITDMRDGYYELVLPLSVC